MSDCGLCPRCMTKQNRAAREMEVQQNIEARQQLGRLADKLEPWQIGHLIGEAKRLLAHDGTSAVRAWIEEHDSAKWAPKRVGLMGLGPK